MTLYFSKKAEKQYKKLSPQIQKKADKQFKYLIENYRHPSLRSRKMASGNFEGRIDYNYRFTFDIEDERIFLLSIGSHDQGLGKK